jgi:hypothetical protein
LGYDTLGSLYGFHQKIPDDNKNLLTFRVKVIGKDGLRLFRSVKTFGGSEKFFLQPVEHSNALNKILCFGFRTVGRCVSGTVIRRVANFFCVCHYRLNLFVETEKKAAFPTR